MYLPETVLNLSRSAHWFFVLSQNFLQKSVLAASLLEPNERKAFCMPRSSPTRPHRFQVEYCGGFASVQSICG